MAFYWHGFADIHNNELTRCDFAWQRNCASSSGHCCSEELVNNTANIITSNWSWTDGKLAALTFFNWHFFVYISINWFWLAGKSCLSVRFVPTPDMFIISGQLEIEFENWNNVANVGETESKVYTNLRCWKLNVSRKEMWDYVFFYSGDQVCKLLCWTEETVGWSSQMEQSK